MKHTIEEIETHLRHEKDRFGFIVKEISFDMIFDLIERNKKQTEQIYSMVEINQHYLHVFFNGDVNEMQKKFNYITKRGIPESKKRKYARPILTE